MAGVRGRAALGLLLALTLLPLAGLTNAATVPYTLFTSFSGGWGFTSGGQTQPGPTLFADEMDTVELTMTKTDVAPHTWVLDYNGDGNWDAGEPLSPSITTNTFYPFLADRAGTFTYLCGVHGISMSGPFQINGTKPSVSVSQPTGSQRWTGGTPHDIVWTMTDPQSPVTALTAWINYTSSAGNGVIAGPVPGTGNPHTQSWNVPLVDVGDMRVNVTVLDPEGNSRSALALVPFVDSTAPLMSSINPVDLAVNVPVTTSLQIAFSEAMDQGATQSAVSLLELPAWTPVPLNLQGWAGPTVTFQPAAALAGNTLYQVNITAAAEDVSDPGNALAPFTSRFLTANAAPAVAVSMPTGAESWTGGSAHDIVWTMTDDITPVAGLTFWINYTSSAGGGTIAGPLPGSANPHVRSWNVPAIDASDVLINVTVADADGGFGHAEQLVPTVDSTAPGLSAVTPLNGTTGVALGPTIQLTFDEPMNQTATELAVDILRLPAWNSVPLTFQGWVGNTLSLTPMIGLGSRTSYQVNVSGARDASDPGNPMPAAWSRFTTLDLSPSVAITFPAGGETLTGPASRTIDWSALDPDSSDIELDVALSESVNGGASWNLVATGLDGPGASTPWSVPAVDTVDALLRADVFDGNSTVSFLTPLFAIDATPPALAVNPPDGAVGVPPNTNVVMSFDEAMNTATADFGLRELPGGAWIAGSSAWGGGNQTFTFTPSALLAPGTTYEAFANATMRDASDPGHPLAAITWNFTTGVTLDTTPPTLANLTAAPDPAAVNQPVNVTADVADDTSVASVGIVITFGITEVVNQSMLFAGGTRWYFVSPYGVPGTYAVAITAADGSGNTAAGSTAFVVGDTSPPSVTSVVATPDPSPYGGSVNITATVTDDVGVASVRLIVRRGGTEVANASMTALGGDVWFHEQPYPSNGTNSITVSALDAAGNLRFAVGVFLVLEPPMPAIPSVTATPDPAEVPATVTLTATAASVLGISGVWFDVGGSNLTATLTGGNWSAVTSATVPGTVPFNVSALDSGGRWATATGAFTARDTTPPAVGGFAPVAPPQTNRTATYGANATDNWGISSVVLDVGTSSVPMNLTGSQYEGGLTLPLGTHAGTVTATDLAGLATVLPVTIVVADTEPPTFLHASPAPVPVLEAITLTVTVADNDRVASASLTFTDVRGVGGTRSLVEGLNTVTLPEQLAAGTVAYGFTATDASGNVGTLPGLTVTVTGVPPPLALYGTAANGWGLGPANQSRPGPTITVPEGQTVSVTVLGYDDVFHFLYVDLNGNERHDPGEPISANVNGNATTVVLSAPAGDYAYYCGIHPTMTGTFRVTATDAGRPETPWWAPYQLLFILIIFLIVLPIMIYLFPRIRRRIEEPETTPAEETAGDDEPPALEPDEEEEATVVPAADGSETGADEEENA